MRQAQPKIKQRDKEIENAHIKRQYRSDCLISTSSFTASNKLICFLWFFGKTITLLVDQYQMPV